MGTSKNSFSRHCERSEQSGILNFTGLVAKHEPFGFRAIVLAMTYKRYF